MISVLLGAVLSVTPVTLAQVREEARNNPQALLSALDAAKAHEATRGARAPLLPQLSLSNVGAGYQLSGEQRLLEPVPDPTVPGKVNLTLSRVPPVALPSFSLQLSLTQLLFDYGKFQALAQAGATEAAAKAQAAENLDFAEYEAIRRFYVLLTAQRSLNVLKDNEQRSREQVDRAGALFEAGRGSQSDVLAAKVNLNNDRITTIRQGTQVAQASADLASWLGRPETDPLEADDAGSLEAPAPTIPALDALLKAAAAHRPLLGVVRQQLAAADHGVEVAKSDYFPRAYLQGAYQRNGNSFDPVFTNPAVQNSLAVSAGFTWDLFSGFATDAQTLSQRHAVSQARINLEQTQRDVEGGISVARVALGNYEQVADVSFANRETATRGLQVLQEQFKAGRSSTLEVRDAQLKLTQAELNLLQSRADVVVARAALQRLSGTLNPGAAQ